MALESQSVGRSTVFNRHCSLDLDRLERQGMGGGTNGQKEEPRGPFNFFPQVIFFHK